MANRPKRLTFISACRELGFGNDENEVSDNDDEVVDNQVRHEPGSDGDGENSDIESLNDDIDVSSDGSSTSEESSSEEDTSDSDNELIPTSGISYSIEPFDARYYETSSKGITSLCTPSEA